MSFLGGLFSAGASILGGILGSKSEKKARAQQAALQQQAWARDDNALQRMVADAQKAGINPAAALSGGGGAGNTILHAPVLSGGAWQRAAEGVGNSLMEAFRPTFDTDPYSEERAQLELDIMRAQLGNINMDTARMLGGAPTATMPLNERSNPYSITSGLGVDPNLPDADIAEQRYGDIAQEIFGIRNLYGDYVYNNPGQTTGPSTVGGRGDSGVRNVSTTNVVDVVRGFGPWLTQGLRDANDRARLQNHYDAVFGR